MSKLECFADLQPFSGTCKILKRVGCFHIEVSQEELCSKPIQVGMPRGAGKKGDLPTKKKRCTQPIMKNVAPPSAPTSLTESVDKNNSQDKSQKVTVTGHDFSGHTHYTSSSYLPQSFHPAIGPQGFQSPQVHTLPTT